MTLHVNQVLIALLEIGARSGYKVVSMTRRCKFTILSEQPLLDRKDSSTPTGDDKPLKTLSKICYGIGGISAMITVGVTSAYLSLFLLELALIRPTYASIVLLGGRAWEAISNPSVGVIINKLDSRFGKIKPWLVCALPFLMLTYFFLWFVPDVSEDIKFVYYLFMYCAYQTSMTSYLLPHISLTTYLSNDQHERDSATVYRLAGALSGTVLGNVIMSQFLAAVERGDIFVDPLAIKNQTITPTVAPEDRRPLELTFLAAAGTVVIFILIFALVVILGTKEKIGNMFNHVQSFSC
ncbi:sodium-dependent lysophosphatidylcholine symporter 1-B-like [Glandiceps talaboti]